MVCSKNKLFALIMVMAMLCIMLIPAMSVGAVGEPTVTIASLSENTSTEAGVYTWKAITPEGEGAIKTYTVTDVSTLFQLKVTYNGGDLNPVEPDVTVLVLSETLTGLPNAEVDENAPTVANADIKYINQVASTVVAAGTNNDELRFRLRSDVTAGNYVLRVGGTEVIAAAEAIICIAPVQEVLPPSIADLEAATNVVTNDVVFTVSNYDEAWKTAITGVSIKLADDSGSSIPVSSGNYTVDGNGNAGTFTIKKEAFAKVAAGEYTVTIVATEFDDVTADFEITKYDKNVEEEAVKTAIRNAAKSVEWTTTETGVISVPGTIAGGETITWGVDGANAGLVSTAATTLTAGTLEGAGLSGSIAAVDVTATIEGYEFEDATTGNITVEYTMFVKKAEYSVPFGNVTGDVTTSKPGNADVIRALEIFLGKKDVNEAADGAASISYDGTGVVKLSDVKLIQIMAADVPRITPDDVMKYRPRQ